MKFANAVLSTALALAVPCAEAQSSEAAPHQDTTVTETFYLAYSSQPNDGNEILTALRNVLNSSARIFLVPSENVITIRTTPDELAIAKKLLTELDRPRKAYRLTYTITESDAGKRIGIQHFAIIAAAGARATLKEGSKLPIETGSTEAGNSTQTQMTYLDIGMNFDATVDDFPTGVRLRSKVEQSSVAEEKSGIGPQDPIVRQSVLEGTSFLVLGKPLVLGSLDVPGSTRHLDIEVIADQVK
jgi:type II secretory pathway component GspD/PulD (secretin)